MSRLRFWQNTEARHRAPGDALTAAYAEDFAPDHCAGETCFHDHAGGPVVWSAQGGQIVPAPEGEAGVGTVPAMESVGASA